MASEGRPPRIGRVLYTYQAEVEDELTIVEGQRVVIRTTDESGWWTGYVQEAKPRKVGLFPSNYLEVIEYGDIDKEKLSKEGRQ